MNIFYLDENPKLCAQYHCDRHVVKMILESAQILCTVINEKAGEQVTPYKSTHINHPCVKWAGKSYMNWSYVLNLMWDLDEERQYRWKHVETHKSVSTLCTARISQLAAKLLPKECLTSPVLCMPEYCKVQPLSELGLTRWDTVKSYRNYYNNEKRHLHKWTNREVPFWIER